MQRLGRLSPLGCYGCSELGSDGFYCHCDACNGCNSRNNWGLLSCAATAAIALDDLVVALTGDVRWDKYDVFYLCNSCNCCSMDGVGNGAASSIAANNTTAFISAIAGTAAAVLTDTMAVRLRWLCGGFDGCKE